MMQSEQMILEEIMQLLDDLNKATYGDYKANGLVISPNANRFYNATKRLYEHVDILVKDFSPDYVSPSNYTFIYNSKRKILLYLDVLRDNRKLKGHELTWELEKYLMELYGLFDCISSYCEKCKK